MAEPTNPSPLTPIERRLLGTLIEKQKTSKSADSYPLSLNALVTGCNQKSNREPVMDLTDEDVEPALADLQRKGLAVKITGNRVERWRHELYLTWKLDKFEMAVLAELLLRGGQTEGLLRGRASRMDDIADLDELRAILKRLAERKFVQYLTPEGRGAWVTHLLWMPAEWNREKARANESAVTAEELVAAPPPTPVAPPPPPPPVGPPPASASDLAQLQTAHAATVQEVTQLRTQLQSVQAQLATLAQQMQHLQRELGVAAPSA